MDDIYLYQKDMPATWFEAISAKGFIACDIETTGLDFINDSLSIFQICIPDTAVIIVQIQDEIPHHIIDLLISDRIQKIFHFAVFDLNFVFSHWHISAKNVACTKVASKLLDPAGKKTHSLQALLQRHLGITIDKAQRLSDWATPLLSDSQLMYAANDVRYLPSLLSSIEIELAKKDILDLAHKCYEHIPTKVRLEHFGYGDIYSYR